MSAQVDPSVQVPQANPHDFPQFLDQVEKDLMRHILDNMKNKRIHLDNAKKLAQEFLELLPIADKTELLEKLNTLGHKYSPARDIFVKYNASEEEEKRQKLLHEMRNHIKNGNIEQAIAAAKGE